MKTRHRTEQTVAKLRQEDGDLGKGLKVPEVCEVLGISEKTYYRRRVNFKFAVRGAREHVRSDNGPEFQEIPCWLDRVQKRPDRWRSTGQKKTISRPGPDKATSAEDLPSPRRGFSRQNGSRCWTTTSSWPTMPSTRGIAEARRRTVR